jgi:hypothetical protein
MRRRGMRPPALAAAGLLAVLAVAPAPAAEAKERVVARVLTPIARDAEPGSRVTVVWTLTLVEAGKRRPFGAGYVFVRLFGQRGARTATAYGLHTRRPGRYRATVRIPRGGVARVAIGVMGTTCGGQPRSCRPSPRYFPIAGPALS